MRISVSSLCILLVALALSGRSAMAQGALDPNCYYPTIGNGIDTIYDEHTDSSFFGYNLIDLGPNPQTGDQRVICGGVPGSRLTNTVLSSGPLVDLHHLQVTKRWNISLTNLPTYFGHFHSPKLLDALVVQSYQLRIYWADEDGNYDSSRYTYLRSSVNGNEGTTETGGGFFFGFVLGRPYIAKLVSDSLDDILLFGLTKWQPLQMQRDSGRNVIELFRGDGLYSAASQSPYLINDSSYDCGIALRIDPIDSSSYSDRRDVVVTGDFRNSGRQSLIAGDMYGNWLFYPNTAPFSLAAFAKSVYYDTLMTRWENPQMSTSRFDAQYAMRVLPKEDWDHSVDLILRSGAPDDRKDAYEFYKGGPEFGTKRLFFDSAFFRLYPPYHYGGFSSSMTFGGIGFCGDMTGTRNPVVKFVAFTQTVVGEYELYYVLGKALDDKIDIIHQRGDGYADADVVPVDADGDRFGDVIYSYQTLAGDSLWPSWTGLALLHGSSKIPVHLNPLYGVAQGQGSDEESLLISPNPAMAGSVVLTMHQSRGGASEIEVVNTLGEVVWQEQQNIPNGDAMIRLDLGGLANGVYYLRVRSGERACGGSLVIER
ncbi:MAG: T9SS type A sorting domain-containing protein [Bacteroidetes bacterium]|nr:T9SS type A sorting domain-containing protein [Bacteroidota bacterium]